MISLAHNAHLFLFFDTKRRRNFILLTDTPAEWYNKQSSLSQILFQIYFGEASERIWKSLRFDAIIMKLRILVAFIGRAGVAFYQVCRLAS